jgi:hypothetical protein
MRKWGTPLIRTGIRSLRRPTVPAMSPAHLLTLLVAFCLAAIPAVAAPLTVLNAPIENAQQPHMAAAPDGTLHLVFGAKAYVEHTGHGRRPPTDGAIYYVRTRDLKTFSAPRKLADLPKIALGMRRGPRIVANGNTLLVTAQSHEDGNVHAWFSEDGGESWKARPRLNQKDGSAREGLHALAANRAALTAAVWLDDRNGGAEVWCRISKDGGSTWEPELLIYASPEGHVCQCCVPSVAVSDDGQIAVMWRNSLAGARDLYASVSKDGGRTFAAARKLGAGSWTLNACPMDGGALIWNPRGEPETVWRRELTVYHSDLWHKEELVASAAVQPLIAYVPQGRVLVWESEGNLILQAPTAAPRTFATSARFASLLPLADGRLAVAWEDVSGKLPQLRFETWTP